MMLRMHIIVLIILFGNTPPPQSTAPPSSDRVDLDALPHVVDVERLTKVRDSLQDKDIKNRRIRAIFGKDFIADCTTVMLRKVLKDEKLVMIKVYVVFRQVGEPFEWCTFDRADANFEDVVDALTKADAL
jgi:hypothetical protein